METDSQRILIIVCLCVCLSLVRGFIFDTDTEKFNRACYKRLSFARLDAFLSTMSTVLTLELPSPELVQTITFRIDDCPPWYVPFRAIDTLQYVDAADVLGIKRNYSVKMPERSDFMGSTKEYIIDRPLYTKSLYIETSSHLRCAKIDLHGCSPQDVCSSTTCANGGSCIGEGVCLCTKGFIGDSCDKKLVDLPIDDFTPRTYQAGTLVTPNGNFLVTGDVSFSPPRKRTFGLASYGHMRGTGANFKLQNTHSSLSFGRQHSYTHAYSSSPSSVFSSRCSSFSHSSNVNFGYNHNYGHQVHFYNTHQGYNNNNAGCSLTYQNNALSMCVNSGNHQHQMQVPWTPSPGQSHTVSSFYSSHQGCSIYVDGQHLGSVNKPVPHNITDNSVNMCYGSCGNTKTGNFQVPHANYTMGQLINIATSVSTLALNGLLGLVGLSPHASTTSPPSTTAPVRMTTRRPAMYSATGNSYQTTASTTGSLMCHSCVGLSKDGVCQTITQCKPGEVCTLFHDANGYTHTCLKKDICTKAKSLTTSSCWKCCNQSFCNSQCAPTAPTIAPCDDTSSCLLLQSTGYDVCSDKTAAANECQKSCHLCGIA